jgi:hypothetical protein
VRALGFTCPDSAESTGPFDADDWESLSTETVRYQSARPQEVDSSGGRSDLEWATDPSPIMGDWHLPWPGPNLPSSAATLGYLVANATKVFPLPGAEACRTMTTGQDAGVAHYDLPTVQDAYTMIGIPTVQFTIDTKDGKVPGELATKLWDVDEQAGKQRLVTKGIYRLEANQDGPITLQLNGSAYTFEPGHHPRLEIAGRDSQSWRASNNTDFTVAVRDLTLTLPTR